MSEVGKEDVCCT